MSNLDAPSEITPSPTDAGSAAPCDVSGGSCCGFTKVIRSLAFLAVLGTAAAYGALIVKPELSEYLSFIPGDQPTKSCPMSGGGSCSSANSACSASTCSSSCVGQENESVAVVDPITTVDEASDSALDASETAVSTDDGKVAETGADAERSDSE